MNKTAATTRTTELEQQRMQRFLHWLQAHGAVFPGIDIRIGKSGRRPHASHALQDGEMVLYVPQALILAASKAKESEIGTWFARFLPELRDSTFLAIYLLWTIRHDGFFKPYTDVLPHDVSDMPVNFSEAELAWLEGTSALRLIRAEIACIEAEYQQLNAHCPPGFSFTLDEYKWAISMVNSCASDLLTDDGDLLMIPLADMMDHQPTRPNVVWDGNPPPGFLCTTGYDVARDAELTVYYGRKGNGNLLHAYGFTLQDNRNDDTELRFPDLNDGADAAPTFNPVGRYNHVSTRKMFACLRSLHGQASPAMLRTAASRENELAVLGTLRR
ncbi:MAG TPA: SET domain-containing protein, partial [Noviherbaspirillum sp.]